MSSLKNHPRTMLLALGLVLGVCVMSFAGWRVGASELGWRWLAQPAAASSAQPQAKRGGRAADAWWARLRGLGSFGLGKAAGRSGANALATAYTFAGAGNWTDTARWSPSYPGLTIASDDAVSIASGAVCTIPNFTTVTINGVLTVNGTLNKDTGNSALTNSASGSISIPAGGAINNNSGNLTNAGTLTTAVSSTFTNGSGSFTNSGTFNNATTFHTQYGSFGNSGTVTNTGTLTGSQYASISNTGSWTNSAGGSLTMNGLSNSAAGTITNNGTMSAGLSNSGTVINNATFNGNYFGITNNAGATWTNSTGSTMPIGLQPWTNSGTWNQNGSFSMTEGSGLSSINNTATGVLNIGGSFTLNGGVPGTNNGTINVNSGGSLALNGSHAPFTNNGTLANSGTVTNASVFKGTGSHTGNVFTNSNGGTVAPGASPGCHSFSNYTNAGTLAIEIGGATPCSQHDQLQASGTATLGGTLTITMFGGYTPGVTTSYTILTAATVSGTFATINYPTVCGIAWSIAYNATNVVVTATVAAQPEINVQGNGVSIADGDPTPSATDHTDFGSVNVSSGTIQRTFTIQNTGAAALTVSNITKSGAQQADFTLGALTPASPIPASGSATFTVTFDPSAAGTRTATINIANSDCDEAAYDFAIQGTGANTAPTVASDAGSKLFIARYAASTIARANVDGTNVIPNAITPGGTVLAIAMDEVRGKMYWTDNATSGHIGRANLDGTGLEPNFITGASIVRPSSISVDTSTGQIYWSQVDGTPALNGVWRANADGTGATQFIPISGGTYAVVVAGGKLYYTPNDGTRNVSRINLDGTGSTPAFLSAVGGGPGTSALAVDTVNQKIYFGTNTTATLGRANLDGSGINLNFVTTGGAGNDAAQLTLDPVAGYLYYTAYRTQNVGRVKLDGSNNNTAFITSLSGSGVVINYGITVGSADFEGTQATRTGTYSDADGNTVTIGANVGSVTKTGTSSGTWTWTYTPPDGPTTVNVTISANDGSATSTTSFTVGVLNVVPTATFAASSTTINENTGAPPSVSFTNPVDPGTVDVSTGLKYSYDYNNDGTWDTGDGTYAGSVSATSQTIPASFFATPAPAQRVVKGRILDKDGGLTDYTVTININHAPTAINGPLAITEDFDYGASAGTLSGNGGAGFSSAWNGGSYTPTGLTFSSLTSPGGAWNGGSGSRNFAATLAAAGPITGDFLFSMSSAPAGRVQMFGLGGFNNQGFTLALCPANDSTPTGGIPIVGLQGGGFANITSGAVALNTTYMYRFSYAGSSITAWILSAAQYDNFAPGGLTDAELNAASIGSGATQVTGRVTKAGNVTGNMANLFTYTFGGSGVTMDRLRMTGQPVGASLVVAENAPVNTSAGTLLASDQDAGDTATFALVTGAGSTDNASFTISGNTVRSAAVFNYEVKNSYSIRVRVTDQGGLTYETPLTVTISNVNEAVTDLALNPSSIAENNAPNATVGTLSATDTDTGDTHSFTLVGGTGSADNGSFTIMSSTLKLTPSADYETKNSYALRVRATDAGGLFFEKALTVTITDVAENVPPTVASDAGSKLFIGRPVGNPSSVARVGTDGTGLALSVVSSTVSVYGVAVDSVHGKVYFTSHTGDRLSRANLDGTGLEANFITVATGGGATGMAIDVVNGHLYWAQAYQPNGGGIMRANLDGTGVTQILSGFNVYDIALNVAGNKIYYAGDFNFSIGRCDLNGANNNRTFLNGVGGGGGNGIAGLAVDLVNGKLYWNRGNGIGQANLDGTGVVNPFIALANGSVDIVPDPVTGKIFWTRNGGAVGRADLNGTNVNESFVTGLTGAWGIDLGSADLEGTVATRTGTYSDPNGDTVTLSANIGMVTKTGTSSGTWTWTYTPPDGPATHNVTITASDGIAQSTTSFIVTVLNLAPTIALTGNNAVDATTTYTLNLGAITDPGTDTVTGYSINWGDGTTENFSGHPTGQSKTHVFSTTGSKTISVALTDEDGTHNNAGTKTVTVNNTAPLVARDNPAVTVNEGSAAANTGTFSDVQGNGTVTLTASLGTVTKNDSAGTWSWVYPATDGPVGPTTVTITATDNGSPALSSTTTFTLTINNVAPLFEAGANETLPTTVGAFSRGPVSFTDPGAEVWTGTVNYGDGTGNQMLTINQAAKSFSLNHTYATSNTFTVMVTVNDDDGGSFTDSFTVTVNLNTPPTIVATANTRQQGSPATVSGIATVGDNEQAAGSLAVTVNGGASATVNGVTMSNLVNSNGTINASIVAGCAASNASFTLTATDNAGATATATLNVTVTANSAPVLSYNNQAVGAAGSLMVNPATGPSDNGSLASLAVLSVTPAMTTAPTVGSNGVVTITNAGPSGSHTIVIRATDNCGAITDASFTLNVTCPTITVGPATIPDGTVGQAYLPTSFTATGGNGSVTFSLSGTLPNGMSLVGSQLSGTPTQANSFSITVTATDAYGCSASKSYSFTISCPAIGISPSSLPIAQINTAYPAQTFTASGGNAPYTINLSGALPAGMSFSGGTLSGTPTAHGSFPLTINVTDKYGCTASRNYTLSVNRPPVALSQNVTVTADANCTASADINNGSNDPDGDTLTITQSPAGPYAVGTRTVTLTVDDGHGGVSTSTATVTVNAPKPVPVITGPASGTIYQVGTPVNFTGTFTDLAGTTHTASWSFDTTTQAGTVTEPSGANPGTVSATKTFTAAGVYLVTLTVTNQCGGQGQATTVGVDQFAALVVVYDPSAGWVTGGGWINSPAGAYVANPALVGKANFGFVSKYHNGATVPTGNTEFHFKAGNLNFKSTSYEWMVIAGAKAQYKGSGTINGAGDYRFMLTAIDGQEPGGGGQDKFRIRIWNNAGGGLVYDNQLNAPDSADPTTVLGGGSIVIHK
jgi:hypothetical protein